MTLDQVRTLSLAQVELYLAGDPEYATAAEVAMTRDLSRRKAGDRSADVLDRIAIGWGCGPTVLASQPLHVLATAIQREARQPNPPPTDAVRLAVEAYRARHGLKTNP